MYNEFLLSVNNKHNPRNQSIFYRIVLKILFFKYSNHIYRYMPNIDVPSFVHTKWALLKSII